MKIGDSITVNTFHNPITGEIELGAFAAEIVKILKTEPTHNVCEIRVPGEKRNRIKFISNNIKSIAVNKFGFKFDFLEENFVFTIIPNEESYISGAFAVTSKNDFTVSFKKIDGEYFKAKNKISFISESVFHVSPHSPIFSFIKPFIK